MYKLKLEKGLSYTVGTPDGLITATKEKPVIEVTESIAAALLETDNFSLVSIESSEVIEDSAEAETLPPLPPFIGDTERVCEPAYSGKTLEEMNVSELETFATYKNVSLKGIRKKDAIINKLREVLPEDELEGIIEYGSPTMTELQES